MITCTRKIEFDAAHRIIKHENKCKMLHGHRYILEASFSAPHLDDLVKVKTKIINIGITSITLHQEMAHAEDDKLLNSADIEIVAIDKDLLRPIKISEQLRHKLQS